MNDSSSGRFSVSEETRGAYRPQVGDTVTVPYWANSEVCTVVVDVPDAEGAYIVRDSGGRYAKVDVLWKVEPTPADRYLVIHPNGAVCAIRQGHATEAAAFECAHHRPGSGARVARFSFAEWVEASS